MIDNNLDRLLGVFCAIMLIVSAGIALTNLAFSWSWILLSLVTIAVGIWASSGIKKVEIGWRGQLLFLGERYDAFFGEGWRWLPFPYGIKVADCRQQIMTLEKVHAITSDDIKVTVGGTVIYRVKDLHTFFNVEGSGLKRGIDDTRSQIIRTQVRKLPLEKPQNGTLVGVLDSHAEIGEAVGNGLKTNSSTWGIEILSVVIPEISPDEKVTEDLQLKKREELQREGQTIELKHFSDMLAKLMLEPPAGAGLTREQAMEQVQMALGKATKAIDAKTITLDPATAAIVAGILKGRS